MKDLFEKIKVVAPGINYLANDTECIPSPQNADTANMVFVELNGYVVGFEKAVTEQEREKVIYILKFGTDAPNYEQLRKAEYPLLEDFADAYYWLQRGDKEPMEKYLAACDVVKEKYKKVTT